MRRMQNEFQCNTCTAWVPGVVLIADTKEEFEKIMRQMPPLSGKYGNRLVYPHDCEEDDCKGKVNVVYAIADYPNP